MRTGTELAAASRTQVFGASHSCCLLFCLLYSVFTSAAETPAKIFELTIPRGGAATKPRVLAVEKDDVVRLRVTSEEAGEIHLHGYRIEMKVSPGAPHELGFKARATGRYRIEWHPTGDTAKKGGHHGPPLATLEVRPK
jgi:hypothetical protein